MLFLPPFYRKKNKGRQAFTAKQGQNIVLLLDYPPDIL